MIANYVSTALAAELQRLRGASRGERATATFRASAAIGNFIGTGEIDFAEAEARLLEVALGTGLTLCEARSQVRRGLLRGQRTQRVIPESRAGALRTRHEAAPCPPTVIPPPPRPPKHEVDDLWDRSVPLSVDPGASEWAYGRYRLTGVVELIEFWDLARAIPEMARLPRWASSRAGNWIASGHRIVFRLWDELGQFASVRVRCIHRDAALKSLAPTGYAVSGMVLADPLGVQLLRGDPLDWWSPRGIVVSEGEPDWLSWAGRQGDAHAQGYAYIGVIAGSWTQQLAARVPDGARVVVRTHHDEQGERYAASIIKSLRSRCTVLRSRAQGGVEG